MSPSRLINRNVIAERGRTSMRLEPELWEALMEICLREGQDVSAIVRIVEQRGHKGGRTSAVRVFVLSYYRAAATEAGHHAVGHGTLPIESSRQTYSFSRTGREASVGTQSDDAPSRLSTALSDIDLYQPSEPLSRGG